MTSPTREATPDAEPEAKPDAEPEAKPDAEPEAKPDAERDARPRPGPSPQGPNAASGPSGKLRVVAIVALVLVALTIPFVRTTLRSSAAFSEYRRATLLDPEAPPRWDREVVDVDGCVDEGITWLRGCEGIQSWCEAELPVVVEMCLASQDRAAYCAEVGDEVLSTRFGFEACKTRREAITDKYAARHHKKACAAAYRAVAHHCERAAGTRAPKAAAHESRDSR